MNKFKKKIEEALNNSNLEETGFLIKQYAQIHPKDMDLLIYNIIYNIYSNNKEIAKEMCLQGIRKYPTCGDIYYNLGYIYELEEDYINSYENYYKAMFLYEKFDINKLSETPINGILINLQNNLEKMIDYYEAIKDLDKLKSLKKLFDLEESFFGLFDGIYNSGEKEVIGTERWLNHKEKRYIAKKDAFKFHIYDYKNLNLFDGKAELLLSTKGKQFLYDLDKEAYLPIASINNNNIHSFFYENTDFSVIQKDKISFSYYKVKPNTYIKSQDVCYYGNPIPIGHSKKRKKLVLNIFVDGLSQTILNNKLNQIMPQTYNYFKDGMIYNNAYSNSDWTYPSIAGAVSGLYVIDNKCFHPKIDIMLPENTKLLAEYFKDMGYYTAKIDGEWRSTPRYGHSRGYDRIIYQNQAVHYDVRATISDVIEHIESFKDTDLFIWTCIGDLHIVADELEMPVPIQNHLQLSDMVIENDSINSVQQSYSLDKQKKYIECIKYVDIYLGLLFSYIKNIYKDEEVLISLFADHGQGYLVPENEHFICKERENIAFMFKDGIHSFVSDEYVSLCDYSAIMCKLANIGYKYDNSAVLPNSLGGDKNRQYVFSECYHPGEPYRITFFSPNYTVYFESKETLDNDGRISLDEYTISIEDSNKNHINNAELEGKYLDIIFKRMEEYLIYD